MKNYSELSDSDKVRAILATVREPVTRKMVLEFAGIDTSKLKEEQQKEFESIMAKHKASQPEGYKGPEKFWVPLDAQESVIQGLGVEWKSVHGQISDVLLKEIDFDLGPEGKV